MKRQTQKNEHDSTYTKDVKWGDSQRKKIELTRGWGTEDNKLLFCGRRVSVCGEETAASGDSGTASEMS